MSEEAPEVEAVSALATPEAHAEATNNLLQLKSRRTVNGASHGSAFSVNHAAAAQLHGWNAHKQATTGELLISEADYLAALEVAAVGGDAHAPALSPYAPKLEAEEPRKVTPRKVTPRKATR